MSTEKSCVKCVIDFCDAFNSSQSNNCNRHDNVYYCSTVCATIRNLTPAQQHAEELLEALKEEHKDFISELGARHYSDECTICQLIAKAEGRE